MLQSVDAIILAYTHSLLVDRNKLNSAQDENDVVAAQEILQNTFRTDIRSIAAEARLRSGGALNPLQFYRQAKLREQLIKERGSKTVSTGL